MTDAAPIRRFSPTPAWLIFGLLLVEGLLWLSERYQWFWFNEKKGWTVLIAVAAVGATFLLMLLWFVVSLLFQWRFQFSLRSLLVLVVVVALPFSWLGVEMKKAREQRNAVEAICNLGGVIKYDYDESDLREGPHGSIWLRTLLEDDFFNDVYNATVTSNAEIEQLKGLPQLRRLWLGGYRFPPTECSEITDAGLARVAGLTQLKVLLMWGTNVTDAGLVHLARQTQLENLSIDRTHVTDAGLAHIAGLAQLRILTVGETQVTDTGLTYLAGLGRLQELLLDDTHVTDAGLAHLVRLVRLRRLSLAGTKVTDAGVKKLQQALPNCKIYH